MGYGFPMLSWLGRRCSFNFLSQFHFGQFEGSVVVPALPFPLPLATQSPLLSMAAHVSRVFAKFVNDQYLIMSSASQTTTFLTENISRVCVFESTLS